MKEMKRKGFVSIQKKFRNISLALMTSLVLAFVLTQCLNGWIQSQSSETFQEYGRFPDYWNKLQEADRSLYGYAQTPIEANRELYQGLLKELEDDAAALARAVGRPEMEDLGRLTEKYGKLGAEVLDEDLDTEERILRYNGLKEYQWLLEGLYDTLYQQMQEYLEDRLQELEDFRQAMNLLTAVIEMGIVLFLFWGNRRLAGQILSPVLELTAQTKQVIGGNRGIEMRYREAVRDELDVLNNSFYRMVETNNRNYESLQRQRELEMELSKAQVDYARLESSMARTKLRLLQSRVNPHFMFNTLNLIAGMAVEEDAEKTTEMVMKTAKYLRYALICLDKAVRLEDELENAMDYLKIQKGRFEERFQVEVEAQEECRRAVVPSMILQPLCENALEYGMAPLNRTTRIWIRARFEEGRLCLSVADDGAGMDYARAEEIRRRLETAEEYDDTQGIGIVNTFQRLKSFYRAVCGEDSQVSCRVESVPLTRTEISFWLPLTDLTPGQAQEKITADEEGDKNESGDC